ncbi:MAG TPA: PQQ-binding-like beta-propeller repeat protein [Gemmatimonadales bacterium]|nr:PQQ-binding-like beta-propeller repeat protein [Gemmatimonadales bacterium]
MRPLPLLLVAVAAATPAAGQTAMFRGTPDHLGNFAGAAPTLQTLVWKFKTGGRVISSPAVAGGTVYVGSSDGNIYAVDRATGTQRWKFATKGPVHSSPAVANGLVYAGSLDGLFYAVDTATGEVKWTFATKGERRFTAPGIHGAMPRTERMPDPFDVFLSSPVVSGNTVIFGSGDQNVYALDAITGKLKWSFATGDVVHASPAVANNVVYIGSWDRNLYAIDLASGRERWRYVTGNDTTIYNQIGIASSAAVSGGRVFVGGRDGHFHVVDEKTGKLAWTIDNRGGWTIASPAVRDGIVYFPTSDGTRFKAVDAATGEVKFNMENKAVSFSSPALVGQVAIYGTSDGWLHAADVKTGAMVAEFQTDGSKENGPKYTDEKGRIKSQLLYPDRTLDGMMIGMRTMMTLGSVLSSPVVVDGVVYFGSTDGNLYAVR